MASYHKSNLGSFGGSLLVDMDGYTHTTAAEWLAAPVDMSTEDRADEEYTQEWAETQAAAAREALESADKAVSEWQEEND